MSGPFREFLRLGRQRTIARRTGMGGGIAKKSVVSWLGPRCQTVLRCRTGPRCRAALAIQIENLRRVVAGGQRSGETERAIVWIKDSLKFKSEEQTIQYRYRSTFEIAQVPKEYTAQLTIYVSNILTRP